MDSPLMGSFLMSGGHSAHRTRKSVSWRVVAGLYLTCDEAEPQCGRVHRVDRVHRVHGVYRSSESHRIRLGGRGRVLEAGLEPARLSPYAPQTYVSANSTTRAKSECSPEGNGEANHMQAPTTAQGILSISGKKTFTRPPLVPSQPPPAPPQVHATESPAKNRTGSSRKMPWRAEHRQSRLPRSSPHQ
jgi:hypothetical protein